MGMSCDVFAVTAAALEGVLANPDEVDALLDHKTVPFVGLEKAWHGLHFLLTGSPWDDESNAVLSFLATGGESVGEDLGYGPARCLPPSAVKDLDDALSQISDDDLWSKFDPARMEAEHVYPLIWDEPEADLRDEYLMYFRNLKAFVQQAHREGNALIVALM